jgi:hypothetical protein
MHCRDAHECHFQIKGLVPFDTYELSLNPDLNLTQNLEILI